MVCSFRTIKMQAMAMAAMPNNVTVRISRSDLYQSMLLLHLLVLPIELFDCLQKNLPQCDGGDMDVHRAALTAELHDAISVAAGKNRCLPPLAAHLLHSTNCFDLRRLG